MRPLRSCHGGTADVLPQVWRARLGAILKRQNRAQTYTRRRVRRRLSRHVPPELGLKRRPTNCVSKSREWPPGLQRPESTGRDSVRSHVEGRLRLFLARHGGLQTGTSHLKDSSANKATEPAGAHASSQQPVAHPWPGVSCQPSRKASASEAGGRGNSQGAGALLPRPSTVDGPRTKGSEVRGPQGGVRINRKRRGKALGLTRSSTLY
jgi:hypothetical protein